MYTAQLLIYTSLQVTTHFEDMKEEQHKQDAKNKEEFEGASEQERMQMQGEHYKTLYAFHAQTMINRTIYAKTARYEAINQLINPFHLTNVIKTTCCTAGARPGAYVRVQLEGVPKEFLEHFDLRFPVVLGGLLPHEQNLGFVRVRLKKHR
jgi:hypothetical protein